MTCQDNAATSSPSPIGSQLSARGGRKADPRRLLRELCRLYAAERLLALELPRLFRQSTSISVRLVLSDQRKETGRQIARLELLIGAADAAHSTTAATAPVPGFQSIGPFNRAFKLTTGLTPSEYRRDRLAASSS